ncbi:sensor histidine kinase [Maritalea mediterranea]|uniref:histidine kinase n=1 Tax=Maritalea mediterranea TaxID=2909667 RepID=A0ABS9E7S9_9HYPH|nr:HAMP domain-containing sensor histidine kinase [Maritalea mediterranea]MCF4097964.1 HAMP domain-containing histidine kinase [Maritalea mediterranea]
MSAADEQAQLNYRMHLNELREDKELLRAMSDLPHGIAYWDRNGNLLWHNHAYRDMMGLSKGTKLRGRSFTNLMALAANPFRFETICDVDDHRVATATCLDGRHIRIEDIAKSQRNFVTIVTDISEEMGAKRDNDLLEKERQALIRQCTADKLAAEAASRSKTSFLAHLSHDMRTPLNHIIGFADMVQHEPFGPLGDKRYIEYLGDIKRSGEALLASFAAILELSELEAGNTIQSAEPIAINELLKSQTGKFKARAERIGVEFVDFSNATGNVFADKNLMQRMLNNILDNAVKFTPKGGKIAINSWDAADGIIVEITDTGIGIPHERMALLNQPFVLGEAAFAKEQNALGLGISTARAIAELNGGRIHIDSAVGIGTTVLITLPRYEVVEDMPLPHAAVA